MPLVDLLENVVNRLQARDKVRQITSNWIETHLKIGFVWIDDATQSIETGAIHLDGDDATVVDTVEGAKLVLQAPKLALTELLSAGEGTDITALLNDIRLLPHDEIAPLKKFFIALGLIVRGDALSIELPFALPLQYPVAENLFSLHQKQAQEIPQYDIDKLPHLICDGHEDWLSMYDYAWQQAFKNFRQPSPDAGFVDSFIDTAFNDNTFIWDSCFMTMFGRYCRPNFDFMGTLSNFYGKQHADGFICREINTYNGQDAFTPQDPRATGPNILAWTEWEDYQYTGNTDRLRAIFPALIAYHRWWKTWRRWSTGGMWTSNLGSGMDNQTRVTEVNWHHNHHVWIDATMQQALSCHILRKMADIIDRHDFDDELNEEYDNLKQFINERMWNEDTHFYHDISIDGTFSTVKTIGAYWGILAEVIPEDRLHWIIEHLKDSNSFNRPHRVPSQSYDSVGYERTGIYWRGGVWSPTNYMVLSGLTQAGYDDLAYDIALNHVRNVSDVFRKTETLWENYAPEMPREGVPSKSQFVGWTGVSAITIPLEYLIGLRWIVPTKHLLWDIRLSERHGVIRYPIQGDHRADLVFVPATDDNPHPHVKINSTQEFQLEIRFKGHQLKKSINKGESRINLTY